MVLAIVPVLAEESITVETFLGDDLLPWLTLALGGALAVGTLLAMVRPPAEREEGTLERPPLGRSLVMIAIGALAAIWGIASLVT